MDKFEDEVKLIQITEEYQEAIDIFPALHKYKAEHNSQNLQKLCVELAEFCRMIYARTQTEEERRIYRKFFKEY